MIRLALTTPYSLIADLVASAMSQTPDITLTRTAQSMRDLRDGIRSDGAIDVALVTIDTNESAPLDLVKELSRQSMGTRLLALCLCSHNVFAVRAMRAGATGFVNGACTLDEVRAAIRSVASGQRHIASNSLDTVVPGLLWPDAGGHQALTDREFEILLLLAEGRSTARIAGDLHLSTSTVNSHRSRVLEKLHLGSVADLIRYAVRNKLIT